MAHSAGWRYCFAPRYVVLEGKYMRQQRYSRHNATGRNSDLHKATNTSIAYLKLKVPTL